jgi:uncharacterized protein (DUF433 family)
MNVLSMEPEIADQAGERIDQILLNGKLAEIAEDIQRKLAEDTANVRAEGRKREATSRVKKHMGTKSYYRSGMSQASTISASLRPCLQTELESRPIRASMQDYVEQRGGGYYIARTRIALDSIVLAFKDGESPETILQSFPMAGPLVRVYGAIIFYLENQEKSETYLRDQERLWALPEALSTRLREAREHAAPRQS